MSKIPFTCTRKRMNKLIKSLKYAFVFSVPITILITWPIGIIYYKLAIDGFGLILTFVGMLLWIAAASKLVNI